MSTRPSAFEQFMMLFGELKRIAGTPQRLVTFYDETSELQLAVQSLESFLLRTDFERRAFAGQKLFRQVPDDFERDWKEYDAAGWAYAIAHLGLRHIFQDLTYKPDEHPKSKTSSIDAPDPESDEEFNPLYHDGAAALLLGLDWLRVEVDLRPEYGNEDDQRVANMCRFACGAYDYLTKTIGVDLSQIFHRWQTLPPFFMPAAVSNRHGDERGSLNDLLADAIRAYVCGAPAAAIALCRSCVELLLKKHYFPGRDHQYFDKKRGEWRDQRLNDLIVLAEKRYDSWNRAKMQPRVRHINDILHDYSRVQRLDSQDDKFILDYLLTLRTLIKSGE